MPDAPGPPGFTRSDPTRAALGAALWRLSAMEMLRPGRAWSRGTSRAPQSHPACPVHADQAMVPTGGEDAWAVVDGAVEAGGGVCDGAVADDAGPPGRTVSWAGGAEAWWWAEAHDATATDATAPQTTSRVTTDVGGIGPVGSERTAPRLPTAHVGSAAPGPPSRARRPRLYRPPGWSVRPRCGAGAWRWYN